MGPPPAEMIRSLEYSLYWLFSLGTVVSALFQIRIPTNSGEVNVNLGDPLAIMTALFVLGLAWQARSLSRFWRAPQLLQALGLITIVLAGALARGYAMYGPIDWAIFNRFIGWLILLAYFCSGALIVIVAGRSGMSVLLRVLVASVTSLVIWELAHRFLASDFDVAFGGVPLPRAEAVAGNPNAFAFQLLMAFAALVASRDFRTHRTSTARSAAFGGLLFAGLWLAGSRAAAGALAAMIVAIAVILPTSTDRTLYIRKLALALIVGAIALTMPDLVAALIGGHKTYANLAAGFAALDTTNVQADRIESLRGGLAMWAAHPIFGAGLGAYIHEHIASTGVPLVIHNSPLWIAAEMGVVGLCAFGHLFARIGNALRTERLWAGPDSQAVALASIAALIVMSLAHDLMYQRLLWLILGAATASPLAARAQIRRSIAPLPRDAGEAQEGPHRFGFSNPNSSNRA